jgi:hypothetical protein
LNPLPLDGQVRVRNSDGRKVLPLGVVYVFPTVRDRSSPGQWCGVLTSPGRPMTEYRPGGEHVAAHPRVDDFLVQFTDQLAPDGTAA